MAQVMVFASVLAAAVFAILQTVKAIVSVPKNLVPIIGLIIGLLAGWLGYPFTDLDLVPRLWAGAFAGLSSTGIFELGKNNPGHTK
ncbi:holin [Paenibacillus odorifer]|nr:holin [Paenibacillus odorifer]OMD66086.1 holin [Paenibacillus odorifer]OMD92800.1 holin [Paenibacillus odorifer]